MVQTERLQAGWLLGLRRVSEVVSSGGARATAEGEEQQTGEQKGEKSITF